MGTSLFVNVTASSSAPMQANIIVQNSNNDVSLIRLRIVLLSAIFYVFIGMILYGRHEGKFRRKSDMDFTGGSVFISALITLSTCLFRVLWSLIGQQAFLSLEEQQSCSVFNGIQGIVSVLIAVMIDLTLWLRQRLLLGEPHIASSFGVLLLFVSRYGILILIGCWLLLLIPLINIPLTQQHSCSITPMANRRALLPLLFCVFNQILGLLMFIFPLKRCQTIWRRRRLSKNTVAADAASESENDSSDTKDLPPSFRERRVCFREDQAEEKRDRLDEIISRISTTTLYAGVISVVPHLTVPGWQIFMQDNYSLTAKLLLGDFAITFNVLGVLFTIVRYDIILLLPLCKIYDMFKITMIKVAMFFQDCGSLLV